MELHWLKDHIHQLKRHLHHFQLMQHQLEVMYHRSQQIHSDPALKSVLMEQYSIHIDRQQKAVEAMRDLYEQARSQLRALEIQQG